MQIPKRYYQLTWFISSLAGLFAMGGVLIVSRNPGALLTGVMYGLVAGTMIGTAMSGIGAFIMFWERPKPPVQSVRKRSGEFVHTNKYERNF